MKSITAQSGQTIFDISLQELGSIEGVFDLLEANPGLRLDMAVSVGTNVKKPTPVIDLRVADYYSRNGIAPMSDVTDVD